VKTFMQKSLIIVAAILLATQVSVLCPCQVRAGEKTEEKRKWTIDTVAVRDAEALRSIKRVVVLVSGAEPYYTNVMQQALAIELRNMGWEIIGDQEIREVVQRDLESWYSELPDSVRANPEWLRSWLLSLPDSVQARITGRTDDVTVAKLIDADAYVTGTILMGRQQYASGDKSFQATAEKMVVTDFALQIVNVKDRKEIFGAVLGYRHGQGIGYAAEEMAGKIIEIMR